MLPMAGFTKLGPVSPRCLAWENTARHVECSGAVCLVGKIKHIVVPMYLCVQSIKNNRTFNWFFSMSTHMMVCVCRWGTKGHCEMIELKGFVD